MRVLLYAIDFAPLVGGEETFLKSLSAGIAEEDGGAELTLVTRAAAGSHRDDALPYRVVRRPGPVALWRLIGMSDVVHVSGPVLFVMLLSLLRRRPVVVTHHLYHAVCPNGLLLRHPEERVCDGAFLAGRHRECLRCNACRSGWGRSGLMYIATVLTRRVCRRISANVAVTDHVARRLDLPRTRTIQHGIQRPTLLSRPPSAAGAGGGIPEFAFVGRLVPEKGLRLLLRAVGRLAGEGVGFRLTIIGDGPQRETLEREVRNLSLEERVHFAGTLEGESLEAALSEVTAVVMPSTWEETAGLVAIEHMMRGGLVVAADVGGLREVVGEAGIRFASGDEAALAASLRQVIEDPAAGVALGRRARDRAEERFGRRRMIVEHLELYRSARAP